jgi:hypothetical protein
MIMGGEVCGNSSVGAGCWPEALVGEDQLLGPKVLGGTCICWVVGWNFPGASALPQSPS